MNSSCTRDLLLMAYGLSVRLAPFCTAQDSSELARRAILACVSAAILGWGLLRAKLASRAARAAGNGGSAARVARGAAAALIASAVAVLGALLPGMAAADGRVYLTKAEIESSLKGRAIVSKNLASGKLSHWEFRPDGTVEAVALGGFGRATGTWSIRDDGQTCVKMLGRTGCRYWFRMEGAYANADTNLPDSPIVAEVRYE